VTETSSTLNEILSKLMINLDLLWQLDESLVLGAKLAKAGLTPTPHITFPSNCQTEEGTASNIVNWLSIEGFDVLRGTGNLSALTDT
jgi:hypothetical protein